MTSSESSKDLTSLLNSIKKCIEEISCNESYTIEKATEWGRKDNISIPFVGLPRKGHQIYQDSFLRYQPPSSVNIMGSFVLSMVVSPVNIDMVVEMPLELFSPKDQFNYVYFYKRSFYLSKIAAALGKAKNLKNIKLSWLPFRGHVTVPILVVSVEGMETQIRIHTAVSKEAFHLQKLGPQVCSVKREFVCEVNNAHCDDNKELLKSPPTPIYNSLLQMETLKLDHLKFIYAEKKRNPAIVDAIKLGKVWTKCRLYNQFDFHFHGFHFAIITAFLSKLGSIDETMSDVHIFKAVLQFIKDFDPKSPCFILKPENEKIKFNQKDYQTSSVCLVEPFVGMNIFFDVTMEVFEQVKRDAIHGLDLLENGNFNELFVCEDDPINKYDLYVEVDEVNWMPDFKANFSHFANQIIPEDARLKMLAKKLRYALGDRITDLTVSAKAIKKISVKSDISSSIHRNFSISLLFDTRNVGKGIDLGPLASDKNEAASFRHFWGDKAELRRFPDGSVRESVVWSHIPPASVILKVLEHVMIVYFRGKEVNTQGWKVNELIVPNNSYAASREEFGKIIKILRSIKDLPLSISHCEFLSTVSRMTSQFPPNIQEDSIQQDLPVCELLIYLEGSTRWPSEYYGLLYAKQAFLIQICRFFKENTNYSVNLTGEFMDIMWGPYCCRCYIYHPEEIKLMEAQGIPSESVFLRNQEKPKHARAISAISSSDSVYAPLCRLLIQWTSSMLFEPQISVEVIELLVAYVLLQKDRSRSLLSGFVRVLHLLVEFKWNNTSILIDFVNQSSRSEVLSDHVETPISIRVIYDNSQIEQSYWANTSRLDSNDLDFLRQKATDLLKDISLNSFNGNFDHSDYTYFDFIGVFERLSSSAVNKLIKKSIPKDMDIQYPKLFGFSPLLAAVDELRLALPEAFIYAGRIGENEYIGFRGVDKSAVSAVIKSRDLPIVFE